jgi:hypothetical protein
VLKCSDASSSSQEAKKEPAAATAGAAAPKPKEAQKKVESESEEDDASHDDDDDDLPEVQVMSLDFTEDLFGADKLGKDDVRTARVSVPLCCVALLLK